MENEIRPRLDIAFHLINVIVSYAKYHAAQCSTGSLTYHGRRILLPSLLQVHQQSTSNDARYCICKARRSCSVIVVIDPISHNTCRAACKYAVIGSALAWVRMQKAARAKAGVHKGVQHLVLHEN